MVLASTQPRWLPAQKDSGRLVGHMDWSFLSPFDLS